MRTENCRIAVLLTCFNRAEKTLECLHNLFKQVLPNGVKLQVFLVDDASPDKTGERVKQALPQVTVIYGTGSLFWCGGMRLAWKTAAEHGDFDYYLWLNDDTVLMPGALLKLLADYRTGKQTFGCAGVLTAACCHAETGVFTYGGKIGELAIEPDGSVQKSESINGNLVLVPQAVYRAIGGLSEKFTHGIGDNEYGMRALKFGFGCWTTSEYLAWCSRNPPAKWSSPATPLLMRFRMLYNVRGLNLPEYLTFLRMYKKQSWIMAAIKANLQALAPVWYGKLKSRRSNKA